VRNRPYLVKGGVQRSYDRRSWRRRRFATGQPVLGDGIYSVEHREHRLPAEVTLRAGAKFPACGGCQEPVRFAYARPAEISDKFQINLYVLPVMQREGEAGKQKPAQAA
jgi:hypothetical protein